MKVYEAINAVQAAMARDGISKSQRNTQQNYAFRGIDNVYNALAPALVAAKLCILPRVLSRETTERQSKNGGSLFFTVLDIEFDFVHTEDGSKHTVRVVGEAMDSADKSCNKAMSAGFKYAAFQAFCIPTDGDNDADQHTHELVTRTAVPSAAPNGYHEWFDELTVVADTGTDALRDAWKQSRADYRNYMNTHEAARWAALKAKAEAVGA